MGYLQSNGGAPGRFYAAKSGDALTLHLYDEVGPFGITAKEVADRLEEAGDVKSITLRINSPGGLVFDGLAIHHLLKSHPARVVAHVDGIAASIASVVMLAADEVVIAENAFVMVHNPMTSVRMAKATELRELADRLDMLEGELVNLYMSRTGASRETVGTWMSKDTYFTSAQAVEAGLAHRIDGASQIAANLDVSKFRGLVRASGAQSANDNRGDVMSHENTALATEVAALRDQLGTVQSFVDECKALAGKASLTDCLSVFRECREAKAQLSELTEKTTARISELNGEISAMKQAEDERKRGELLDAMCLDGQIAPSERELYGATAMAQLEGFRAKLPKRAGKPAPQPRAAADLNDKAHATPGVLAMCKKLGITFEQYTADKAAMAGKEAG